MCRQLLRPRDQTNIVLRNSCLPEQAGHGGPGLGAHGRQPGNASVPRAVLGAQRSPHAGTLLRPLVHRIWYNLGHFHAISVNPPLPLHDHVQSGPIGGTTSACSSIALAIGREKAKAHPSLAMYRIIRSRLLQNRMPRRETFSSLRPSENMSFQHFRMCTGSRRGDPGAGAHPAAAKPGPAALPRPVRAAALLPPGAVHWGVSLRGDRFTSPGEVQRVRRAVAISCGRCKVWHVVLGQEPGSACSHPAQPCLLPAGE